MIPVWIQLVVTWQNQELFVSKLQMLSREVLHKRQGASIEPETPEGNSSLSTPMGTSKISSSRIRALLLGKS